MGPRRIRVEGGVFLETKHMNDERGMLLIGLIAAAISGGIVGFFLGATVL
jgi:hypothetical protein